MQYLQASLARPSCPFAFKSSFKNTKSIIFNEEFIIVATKFIDLNTNGHLTRLVTLVGSGVGFTCEYESSRPPFASARSLIGVGFTCEYERSRPPFVSARSLIASRIAVLTKLVIDAGALYSQVISQRYPWA